MNEFLSFRKMVTPMVIQIMFWLGVAGYAIFALLFLVQMTNEKGFIGFILGAIGGLIIFVVGSLMVRIWCELIILLFKIYDELKAIRTGTPPEGMGFPVIPVATAAPVTPVP